jgi:putative endonuclease
MNKKYYVYIATNKSHTLYIGVTNNLQRRMYEHRNKIIKGFTEKYNINKLVHFQEFNTPEEAISAEKKIKGWIRVKKIKLIKSVNPDFKDLLE